MINVKDQLAQTLGNAKDTHTLTSVFGVKDWGKMGVEVVAAKVKG